MNFKLLSFDVWDTLIVDDSDEIIRRQHGLPSKAIERNKLYHNVYENVFPDPSGLQEIINDMENQFTKLWKNHFETPGIRWRLNQIEKCIGKEIKKPVMIDEKIKQQLILRLEEMEIQFPIQAVKGTQAFFHEFKQKYPMVKLGIISDAIYTPGKNIRRILENCGLLEFFEFFAFSDEVGHSKPSREIFQYLAKQVQVSPHEIVHIGDRLVNDIEGAKNFGATGILCRASKTSMINNENVSNLMFDEYLELKNILSELENK